MLMWCSNNLDVNEQKELFIIVSIIQLVYSIAYVAK